MVQNNDTFGAPGGLGLCPKGEKVLIVPIFPVSDGEAVAIHLPLSCDGFIKPLHFSCLALPSPAMEGSRWWPRGGV